MSDLVAVTSVCYNCALEFCEICVGGGCTCQHVSKDLKTGGGSITRAIAGLTTESDQSTTLREVEALLGGLAEVPTAQEPPEQQENDEEAPEAEEFEDDVLEPQRGSQRRARREMPANKLNNPAHSGRDRARRLYPLPKKNEPQLPCEWRNDHAGTIQNNGNNGLQVIEVCGNGVATVRHHGPDKSTLNNSPGNVHRICAQCHNRWHKINDEIIGTGR